MGDMNAKTGKLNDYLINDELSDNYKGEWYSPDLFSITSESCDEDVINNFGGSLIYCCKTHDVHILNSKLKVDRHGTFRCLSHRGCSVSDYALC